MNFKEFKMMNMISRKRSKMLAIFWLCSLLLNSFSVVFAWEPWTAEDGNFPYSDQLDWFSMSASHPGMSLEKGHIVGQSCSKPMEKCSATLLPLPGYPPYPSYEIVRDDYSKEKTHIYVDGCKVNDVIVDYDIKVTGTTSWKKYICITCGEGECFTQEECPCNSNHGNAHGGNKRVLAVSGAGLHSYAVFDPTIFRVNGQTSSPVGNIDDRYHIELVDKTCVGKMRAIGKSVEIYGDVHKTSRTTGECDLSALIPVYRATLEEIGLIGAVSVYGSASCPLPKGH